MKLIDSQNQTTLNKLKNKNNHNTHQNANFFFSFPASQKFLLPSLARWSPFLSSFTAVVSLPHRWSPAHLHLPSKIERSNSLYPLDTTIWNSAANKENYDTSAKLANKNLQTPSPSSYFQATSNSLWSQWKPFRRRPNASILPSAQRSSQAHPPKHLITYIGVLESRSHLSLIPLRPLRPPRSGSDEILRPNAIRHGQPE